MALEAGQFISSELSYYVKKWVSNPELTEIARKNNLSPELARLISSSNRKLTDGNMQLMKDILQRAINNRNKKIEPLETMHVEALELVKTTKA